MFLLFCHHSFRYFSRHKLLSFLNVFGIALGVAIFVSVQAVNHSALQSFRASIDIVSGKANLELVGNGLPFDETIYPKIRSLKGIAAATPLVETVATPVLAPDEYLQIIGLDPFSNGPFRTFTLKQNGHAIDPLSFLENPSALALTESMAARLHVRLGDPLLLQTDSGVRPFKVTFLIAFNEDAVGVNDHIAMMDIANAQENFGMSGHLSRISCQIAPDQDLDWIAQEIRTLVPSDVLVQAPDRRGKQVDKMLGAFELNLTSLSLVSLLVGMFLIYNTVSTAVMRRRSEIGILRALGLQAIQVQLFFICEALVLGILGLVLGILGGLGLAELLIGQVSETITSLYLLLSIREIFVSPLSLLGTAALGLGAVILAAWFPAREAALIPPVQALQVGYLEVSFQQRTPRLLFLALLSALLALCLGWASLAGGPHWLSFGTALFTLLTFALCVPTSIRWITRCLRPRNIISRVALRTFGSSLHRNSITIAALVTAIAMLVGVSVMIFSFRTTVNQWLNETVKADLFITDSANFRAGTRKLVRPEVEHIIRNLSGLETYDTYRELELTLHGSPFKLSAIRFPVAASHNLLRFHHGQGSTIFRRAANQDQVCISEPFARKFGFHEGETLSLSTPAGILPFTVIGVFQDYTSDLGVVMIDSQTYQKHWHDLSYNSFALYLQKGVSSKTVQATLKQSLLLLGSYMVYSNQELRSQVFQIFDQTFRVTYLLQAVALLVSGLGIFLNLIIMIAERRREIGILRSMGTSRFQMISMILQEAALLGGLGSALGLAAGLALTWVLSNVINIAFFGWTIAWATPWLFLCTLPFTVIVTSLASGFWPARTAAHGNISQAVKME